MEIKNLQHCSFSELNKVFNSAFANYFVPLQLTEEQLLKKLNNDGISLDFSAGAFQDHKLVGFIFNGIGIRQGLKMAYNGGTGVIPKYRGQQIPSKIYEFLLPQLKTEGVQKCILEVIDKNIPAIRSYRKIGFSEVRELISFKGEPKVEENNKQLLFEEIEPEWKVLRRFRNFEPSWQFSEAAIKRSENDLKTWAMKLDNQLIGFAVFNPSNARIIQFGVDHKKSACLKFLFKEISQHLQQPLTFINIDKNSTASIDLLTKIGLQPFLTQHEMSMDL